MADGEWQMRIEGGLSAHFNEPGGGSRPGVQWAVGLKQGAKTYKVLVKALFADDASQETRKDQESQAQAAMAYLDQQLRAGWHPDQEKEHTIYITNPRAAGTNAPPAADKPWWKVW